MKAMDHWHVEPVNDTKPHLTGASAYCRCNPRVEPQPNGNVVVVHNAYDGREFFENDPESYQHSLICGTI